MKICRSLEDCPEYKRGSLRLTTLADVGTVCRALVAASGRGPAEIDTWRLARSLFVLVDDGTTRVWCYRPDVDIPRVLRESAYGL
jgi:hypothetical protein